jgi:hypothetical protein
MKKIILLTIMLTVIAGTAVFANGEQEGGFDNAVRPRGSYGEEPELLSLTGTLKLAYGQRPELVTGDEEYELLYPYYLAEGLDIEDGETVAVEGFIVPGHKWKWEENEKHLRVTKAVIDGEEYDLEAYGPGFGPMMGGRYGSRRGGLSGGLYPDCPNCGEYYGTYGGGRRRGMMGGRYGGPGTMGGFAPRGRGW